MAFDPILLEVLNSRLSEIVQTMERQLFHSGYSPILRESYDGSAAILNACGEVVMGAGMPIHLFPYYYVARAIIARQPEMEPGDCFIINDPFLGGSLHVPDMAIVTPVFHEGERIAFCASIAHKPDVGGMVPGSSSADSREIYHEGLVLPGVRYLHAGRPSRDIEAVLRTNSRTPDEVIGDVRAQVGCTKLGGERLVGLCGEYGRETILETFELLIERAERLIRQGLQAWTDGNSEATAFLDHDGVDLDHPVKLTVHVEKRGDGLMVDYSQSDPQTRGPVSIRNQAAETAAVLALLGYIDPAIPINDAARRVVRFVNPLGRVTNAAHPAPINNYYGTMHVLYSCVQAALSHFCPEQATAPDGLGTGGLTFGFQRSRGGRPGVQYELLATSLGATPVDDGTFTALGMYHITASQPVEILETEYPVQVLRLEPICDSAGAGKFRGGAGCARVYRVLDDAKFTLRMGQFACGNWGVRGGRPGTLARCLLYPGTEREEALPPLSTRDLVAGDVVRFEMSGGGGYGDPRLRDPQQVLRDVRNGLVSLREAREVYGVAISPKTWRVATEETARLRKGTPG